MRVGVVRLGTNQAFGSGCYGLTKKLGVARKVSLVRLDIYEYCTVRSYTASFKMYKLIMFTSKSVPGGTNTSWPESPFCAAVARVVSAL